MCCELVEIDGGAGRTEMELDDMSMDDGWMEEVESKYPLLNYWTDPDNLICF